MQSPLTAYDAAASLAMLVRPAASRHRRELINQSRRAVTCRSSDTYIAPPRRLPAPTSARAPLRLLSATRQAEQPSQLGASAALQPRHTTTPHICMPVFRLVIYAAPSLSSSRRRKSTLPLLQAVVIYAQLSRLLPRLQSQRRRASSVQTAALSGTQRQCLNIRYSRDAWTPPLHAAAYSYSAQPRYIHTVPRLRLAVAASPLVNYAAASSCRAAPHLLSRITEASPPYLEPPPPLITAYRCRCRPLDTAA